MVAAVCGVIAGCGEESSADFLARADSVCARGGDDDLALAEAVERVYEEDGSDVSLAGAEETFDQAVETFEGIVGDLRELNPPDEVATDFEDVVDLLEGQVAQLRLGRDAAARQDAEDFAEVVEDEDFAVEAEQLERVARDVGFEECGIEETD